MNEQAIFNLDELIKTKYNQLRKKYKQYCFINKFDYSDDTFNDTYYKVRSLIERKGIKDESPKGVEDYFFKAFKKNTFLAFQNKNKINKIEIDEIKDNVMDDNINESEIKYNEMFDNFKLNYILEKVAENFDSLSFRCWKVKRLIKINNRYYTYSEIKEITHIKDVKKRIVAIDKWIKQNINENDIKDIFEKNYV